MQNIYTFVWVCLKISAYCWCLCVAYKTILDGSDELLQSLLKLPNIQCLAFKNMPFGAITHLRVSCSLLNRARQNVHVKGTNFTQLFLFLGVIMNDETVHQLCKQAVAQVCVQDFLAFPAVCVSVGCLQPFCFVSLSNHFKALFLLEYLSFFFYIKF